MTFDYVVFAPASFVGPHGGTLGVGASGIGLVL